MKEQGAPAPEVIGASRLRRSQRGLCASLCLVSSVSRAVAWRQGGPSCLGLLACSCVPRMMACCSEIRLLLECFCVARMCTCCSLHAARMVACFSNVRGLLDRSRVGSPKMLTLLEIHGLHGFVGTSELTPIAQSGCLKWLGRT